MADTHVANGDSGSRAPISHCDQTTNDVRNVNLAAEFTIQTGGFKQAFNYKQVKFAPGELYEDNRSNSNSSVNQETVVHISCQATTIITRDGVRDDLRH